MKKTAANAKQRHQQDLRGLEEGSWRQEWVAEETVVNLPFKSKDQKKKISWQLICHLPHSLQCVRA